MKYFSLQTSLILIILIIATSTSCTKKFLDVDNTEQLFRQSYVKDLTTMQEFMNGNYVSLAWYLEEGSTAAYPELVADNIRPVSFTSTMVIPHYAWNQVSDGTDFQNTVDVKPESKAMDALWRMGYRTIRACSFVVEDIDKYRDENPAKADDIKGQALALRAYIHFKLVNTFAQHYSFTNDAQHPGVPYITTSDITEPFSRQTVAEVYKGIINDLTNSIGLLPEVASDVRLLTRNAAKGLLARVYLFKEDYLKAKELSVEVANLVPLMTIANGYPDDLFKFKPAAQTESLFQLSPKSSGYTTNFLGLWLNLASVRRFVATSDVTTILKENSGDIRRNWVNNSQPNQNFITKFPKGVAPEVTPAVTPVERAYYPVIIRSSEMFLIAAEAAAKTNDENTAHSFLNAIRKRANPAIDPIVTTGPALLDSIYKERRKELAFEGLRMYDLQRIKKGVKRTDVLQGSPQELPYPSNKAIAPIPLSEIKLASLPQNTDY